MVSLAQAFDFVEGDRVYSCRVEAPRRGRTDAWWWFAVSGDAARYAPFRAEPDDTEASVRPRVVAYYEDRVARRGLPWQDRGPAPTPSGPPAGEPPPGEPPPGAGAAGVA